MSAPLATDYDLAERVALALAPLSGLAAVLLGGVGDDWLRAPAYPYAVVAPSEAESARGQTTRTIRVRLAVRGADAASKPEPAAAVYGPWTFADGLLEAAQAHFAEAPWAANSRLEAAPYTDGSYDVWIVGEGYEPGDLDHGTTIATATLSAAGLALDMVAGMPFATEIVPPGEPVATRAALPLLRVGAGPALDALVQAARDALASADLGAPLESIATSYDPDPQFPVQSAELLVALSDPHAYGDSF